MSEDVLEDFPYLEESPSVLGLQNPQIEEDHDDDDQLFEFLRSKPLKPKGPKTNKKRTKPSTDANKTKEMQFKAGIGRQTDAYKRLGKVKIKRSKTGNKLVVLLKKGLAPEQSEFIESITDLVQEIKDEMHKFKHTSLDGPNLCIEFPDLFWNVVFRTGQDPTQIDNFLSEHGIYDKKKRRRTGAGK